MQRLEEHPDFGSVDSGHPSANYIIITLYYNGQDCIPEHSDKTDDFDENSLLTVVKLGPKKKKKNEKYFFSFVQNLLRK
eukprot:COSAG01_NODE_81_length_27820_cov_22.659753_18_plen_79_part_00